MLVKRTRVRASKELLYRFPGCILGLGQGRSQQLWRSGCPDSGDASVLGGGKALDQ